MADVSAPQDMSNAGQPVVQEGPSTAVLAKSVRGLRTWLIVLTSLMGLAFIGTLIVVIVGIVGVGSLLSVGDGVSKDEITSAKSQVKSAYGDRLESLEVRAIKLDDGTPFSALSGDTDAAVYVHYKLKDSPVVVADLVEGPGGNDAASYGILPTQGSLTSRMTTTQLNSILAAYASQTTVPLGAVRRYADEQNYTDTGDGSSVPAVVSVGEKKYKTSELWAATEGKIVKGDTLNYDDVMNETRTAFIFHEDPKTGQFTFLGTESASNMW